MSKITFRADEDLVARIEAYDASKSEVMREALRAYLDGESSGSDVSTPPTLGETALGDTLDALIRERVETLVDRRLEERRTERRHEPSSQDINVTVSLEGERATRRAGAVGEADPEATSASPVSDATDQGTQCSGCGETIDASAVYCSNCGEKANHRVFCDCGDELRSDWSFCPGCGRRTPAADVLERS